MATKEQKTFTALQREAILQAYEERQALLIKAHREARKIAEDIADDKDLAVDEIESRIKDRYSFLNKCAEKGLYTPEEAIENIRDTVGVRVISRYIDKIPSLCEALKKFKHLEIKEEKNYNPKDNGYRGFHVIASIIIDNQKVYIEFQFRTMAQHLWASFEHILRYKNRSLEISEAKDRVFRVISDKLYEVDLMIVKLRNDCEPDTVVIETSEREKSLLTSKIVELATEATLASANVEASKSVVPPTTNKKNFFFKRKKKKKKKH